MTLLFDLIHFEGLQLGYLYQQAGRDYVMYERSDVAG